MRHLFAICLLLPLAACYDFEGDDGVLGFSSNLVVGTAAWTPEQRIAVGTQAVFAPTEWLASDRDVTEEDVLVGDVDGSRSVQPLWAGDSELAVKARRRGSATLWWDGDASDGFTAHFAPVGGGALEDPIASFFGLGALEGDVALVAGQAVELAPVLLDRQGEPLGVNPEELSVDVSGDLSGWLDENHRLVISADAQPGSDGLITVLLGEEALFDVGVQVVHRRDIARIELETVRESGQRAVLARTELSDGTPVLGAPVEWSWARGEAEVGERADLLMLTGARGPIEARVGDVSAVVGR